MLVRKPALGAAPTRVMPDDLVDETTVSSDFVKQDLDVVNGPAVEVDHQAPFGDEEPEDCLQPFPKPGEIGNQLTRPGIGILEPRPGADSQTAGKEWGVEVDQPETPFRKPPACFEAVSLPELPVHGEPRAPDQQVPRRPDRWLCSSSMGTRTWVIVSLSRIVTVRFSRDSKSTVMQKGVPTSSWRR